MATHTMIGYVKRFWLDIDNDMSIDDAAELMKRIQLEHKEILKIDFHGSKEVYKD